ncbi:TetR family transcriptional regulator [Ensifer adhaerens]|uniref:TetR/AcrR family transcriptional regulator n=1 Tax=Ensifer adhaerens TaxID=106592 RepID=UPI001CC08197|nr:TetR/AcrR family transcriptional regulator [Ensifer adhaerens]MBZ7922616.1 TetR family transcriptional regulator [Ensifer adhaerens]UAX91236.1 TetR family transcriptional regulator [Ensifer adhaerens]UAX98864.1 TetR family transcriptional regulator [Ensifer adhaerens]UAY06247.1 TetR family transcriptional regulator [Ensifer adhaerens]
MITDTNPTTPPAEDETTLRRTPSQKRSRERVEQILSCATALIQEKGSDAMRMSDVAEKAGISIGSLYQYFPDKAAIVRTLAERYNAVCNECISAELAKVTSMAELRDAFSLLFDIYYDMFLAEPVMRDIWSAMQADKALREVDLQQSRAGGKLLADVWARFAPETPRETIDSAAFLIMHLGDCTMRLAVSVDRPEGDRIVEAYKQMMLRDFVADEAAGGAGSIDNAMTRS